jgi:hypothetical protein
MLSKFIRNEINSKRVALILLVLLGFTSGATSAIHLRQAQPPNSSNLPTLRRSCGTGPRYETMFHNDIAFQNTRKTILQFTQSFATLHSKVRIAPRGAITIPVVVHVLYNTDVQNISDAQIKTQFDVLNRDYQLQNSDNAQVPDPFKSVVGNPNLKFALAAKAPDGSSTTGIIRTKTNEVSFAWQGPKADWIKFTAKGGSDAWPRDRYLNLWVGPVDEVLGYASFPGEASETDGVVISYLAFGTTGTAAAPFNLGRTATHEIGHWLNLFHIWGDKSACTGSDQVDDTPTQADPNYGQPAFPHHSCRGQSNGDMFMNYMDYVDDQAMFTFTKGQVLRMDATLSGPRGTIVASPAMQ